MVGTAKSRKRSIPPVVATQIFPSRSSNKVVNGIPREAVGSGEQIGPTLVYVQEPPIRVPIHRPPLRSRKSLRYWAAARGPQSGRPLLFPPPIV